MAGKKGRPQPLELANDLVVTQYGERNPGRGFRDRLRVEQGETEISLIAGNVSAEDASRIVTKSVHPLAVVRTSSVGTLRAAGFLVVHSPTRYNSSHVSVYPPKTASGDPMEWDDDLAKSFTECFTSDESGGDDGE